MATKAEDVYGYFQYVWLINRCVGLSNRSVKSSFKKTKLITICRYLYNIVACSIALLFVYCKGKRIKIQRNIKLLPQYADILMLSSILFGAALTIAENLFRQDQLQTTVKQIQIMEHKLDTWGERVAHKRNKLRILLLLGCTGLFWTIHFVYYNFCADGVSRIDDFFFWTRTYIPFIVSNVYIIQFTAFCLAIGTLYQTFNALLTGVLTGTSKIFVNKRRQTEHLYELQIFYNRLYKMLTTINDIHSLPILIMFATNFIFMFACSYFCLFGYMYKFHYVKPVTFSDYLIPIIPGIPIFLQFLVAISASEYVTKTRMDTTKIIYNLPVLNDEVITKWVSI